MGSEVMRHLLYSAGTAMYDQMPAFNLEAVPKELSRITDTFVKLGYQAQASIPDPDHEQLRKLFEDANDKSTPGDYVVAYYSGHGGSDQERYYLLTRNSKPDKLDRTALAAEDLLRAIAKESNANQILVILDACYAAAGTLECTQLAARLTAAYGGHGPAIYLLAAARTKQEAQQNVLPEALAYAVDNALGVRGGAVQAYFALDDVIEGVKDFIRSKHVPQTATWSSNNIGGRCRLFPNPRYRANISPGLDLESQRSFSEHWEPKVRGVELGSGGWYFTGREQALREIVAWLRQEDSGGKARVVTGGAGCGKSALLARIVTLSNPHYRQLSMASTDYALAADTLPPENVVNVAIHLRHKLLDEIVAEIASHLELDADNSATLLDAIHFRSAKTVMVFDALDEAEDPNQIIDHLLRPLAKQDKVFLLIGTRPDSTDQKHRFSALGATVEIDLNNPCYIGSDDVACYVARRLLATEEPGRTTVYSSSTQIADKVANALAHRAGNVFHIARTAVTSLLNEPFPLDASQPGWECQLPSSLKEAFEQFLTDIDRRRPDNLSSKTVLAVLRPLAFAEGEGLPWVRIWPAVATSLAGSPVTDADIECVCKHAAAFIVEALESDRSVYRLYHESLAEYFRSQCDPVSVQKQIVEALRSRVPVNEESLKPNWIHAHPYILTHLLSHAAKAGNITEWAKDGRLLAAADPLRALRALAHSPESIVRRAHDSYALAIVNLSHCGTDERLSYLELAARQLGDDELADAWVQQSGERHWSISWVSWRGISPHRVIPQTAGVSSLALRELDGRQVIASGSHDGVHIWDLATGLPWRIESLHRLEGMVTSVVLGEFDGRPVIVSGSRDKTVRIWNLTTGSPRGRPLGGHAGTVTSVALGEVDGRTVIVSGSYDKTVRIWDVATGAPWRIKILRGHEGEVTSVALGELDGKPVVVSGSRDKTVRIWDLTTGTPLGEPLRGHDDYVTSVALGELKGKPVVVSGSGDKTVRIWDLATGSPRVKLLHGHDDTVTSVALGEVDGRTVIVSGSYDKTVRIWDVATGAPWRIKILRGHDGEVTSVALGELDGKPVVVSGSRDKTVRIWDLTTGSPGREPLYFHRHFVNLLAQGSLDGQPVIVSGSLDGVQIWDLDTGSLRREPFHFHRHSGIPLALGALDGQPVIVSGSRDGVQILDLSTGSLRRESVHFPRCWVHSVALGELDGQPVIVSGSRDEVRIWDLATGSPRGWPLLGHNGWVNSLALGELDGRTVIVSGGVDTTVRIWDMSTGTPLGEPLRGHDHFVNSVALGSLDGHSVIVSGSCDKTVRIWDLTTGTPLGEPLRGHDDYVTSVALGTLDGRPVIVSGSTDSTVRVWNDSADPIAVNVGSGVTALVIDSKGDLVVATLLGLVVLRLGKYGLKKAH